MLAKLAGVLAVGDVQLRGDMRWTCDEGTMATRRCTVSNWTPLVARRLRALQQRLCTLQERAEAVDAHFVAAVSHCGAEMKQVRRNVSPSSIAASEARLSAHSLLQLRVECDCLKLFSQAFKRGLRCLTREWTST